MPNLPPEDPMTKDRAAVEADSALWLLNLVDDLTRDVTPEQWAEIRTASEAAKREECCASASAGQRVAPLR